MIGEDFPEKVLVSIGPVRTGSTSIYSALLSNENVSLSEECKEIFFFDKFFYKGEGWYKSFFTVNDRKTVAFDFCPSIFGNDQARCRVKEVFPKAKIVIVVRDPVERAVSHVNLIRRYGFTFSSFDELLRKHPEIIEESSYKKNIPLWVEDFGENNVLVVNFEDIKKDFKGVIREVFAFAGISLNDEVKFVVKENAKNATYLPRSRLIGRTIYVIRFILLKAGMRSLVGKIKNNGLVRKILFKDGLLADSSLDSAWVREIESALKIRGEL